MLGGMKVKAKVWVFGALGLGAIAYAAFRKPRYLYDGEVLACEGSQPLYGAFAEQCTQLSLKRGGRSGKVYAPFTGTIAAVETDPSPVLVLKHATKPELFRMVFERGAPRLSEVGMQIKSGELLGQTELLVVSAARLESGKEAPMPPSAWLATNGFVPASVRGQHWCEDSSHQIVPSCPGVTFRAPELPKWSLKSVRLEIL
jgi:hypothetical protein